MKTVSDTPLRTVVVTGGIGSGKSMVCALLAEKGIPVYDSDSRAKALYNGPLLQQVEAAFGRRFTVIPSASSVIPSASSVIPSGCEGISSDTIAEPAPPAIDFAALSAAAFASPDSLALLESIVHPAVLEDFTAWRASQAAPPFVVLESAIILSKPLFDGLYDTVVLVYAPEEQRISRVLARNPGLSAEAVRRRIAAQSLDFARADYLLINDATPSALNSQVEALYATLIDA